MLVLTRKTEEKIQIGQDITITVLRIKGHSVRIGIEAPDGVTVLRQELVLDHQEGGKGPESDCRIQADEADSDQPAGEGRSPAGSTAAADVSVRHPIVRPVTTSRGGHRVIRRRMAIERNGWHVGPVWAVAACPAAK